MFRLLLLSCCLVVVVVCETARSTRLSRFGQHNQRSGQSPHGGGRYGGTRTQRAGYALNPDSGSTHSNADFDDLDDLDSDGYGLIGGSEDVNSREINFGDLDDEEDDEPVMTSHRYVNSRRKFHRRRYGVANPRRRGRQDGRSRQRSRQRNAEERHQQRRLVKRQIIDDGDFGYGEEEDRNVPAWDDDVTDGGDLTDALTDDDDRRPAARGRGRGMRRPWRQFMRGNPWWAGLGLGQGDGFGWRRRLEGAQGLFSQDHFGLRRRLNQGRRGQGHRGQGRRGWQQQRPGHHSRGHHFNVNLGSGGFDFGVTSFGGSFFTQTVKADHWTDGPHVCRVATENVERFQSRSLFSARYSHSCQDKVTLYTCTTIDERKAGPVTVRNTTVVTQSCCPGYNRTSGDEGCPRPLNLTSMENVVRELGLTEFTKALNDSNLGFVLTAANMTLFIPTNQALSNYQPDTVDLSNYVVLNADEQAEILSEGRRLLEGHLVEKVVTTDHMIQDQVIETLHPQTTIRINKYPNKVVTANCARLVKPNLQSKTGVVHVIDDVIVQERGTIYDFIKGNKDLAMFYQALSNTSLSTDLRRTDHVYTIFAPSNQAFQKLGPDLRQRLLRDGDGTCISNVLRGHVVKGMWCGAGMTNGTSAKSLLDRGLLFTRDAEENLYVNGVLVQTDDYVTENGVVHVITNVMATSALALDIAEENGATHIVSLFNAADMVAEVADMQNATLFLPTDQAFASISPIELDALRSNDAKLKELLNYHIVNGKFTSADMRNGNHLPTRSDSSLTVTETVATARRKALRFRDRRRSPMRNIQCARIVKKDLWTCSGKTVVHLIDKMLLPPVGSILEVLKQDEPQFSTFLSMVRRANMTGLLGNGHREDLTLFLPTNEALEVMPPRLRASLSDVANLRRFIKGHIVNASICCSSARTEFWGASVGLRTLTGQVEHWRWAEQAPPSEDRAPPPASGVLIGQNPVRTCDITATNGIVHVVDGYLTQESQRWNQGGPLDDLFADLFDN